MVTLNGELSANNGVSPVNGMYEYSSACVGNQEVAATRLAMTSSAEVIPLVDLLLLISRITNGTITDLQPLTPCWNTLSPRYC